MFTYVHALGEILFLVGVHDGLDEAGEVHLLCVRGAVHAGHGIRA